MEVVDGRWMPVDHGIGTGHHFVLGEPECSTFFSIAKGLILQETQWPGKVSLVWDLDSRIEAVGAGEV